MKGKAYVNKKKKEDRPLGDFYGTPISLLWVVKSIIQTEFKNNKILEPCFGKGNISNELKKWEYDVEVNDLFAPKGVDYLTNIWHHDSIITNPPFSLWDEFIMKAKEHCHKFMFIGKMNFLGTYNRWQNNLWKHLKKVYVFNRMVDYRTPFREDGYFHVGNLVTGWFLWDMSFEGSKEMDIINVQPYAKLGQYKCIK